MIWLTDPQFIPMTQYNTWETRDLTSFLGGDAGNVAGVYLYFYNTSLSNRNYGAQHPDSTDGYLGRLNAGAQTLVTSGINASNEVEINLNQDTLGAYLVGYFLNSEAVFFPNVVPYTVSVSSTWENVDISSHTGGNTAKLAFLNVREQGNGLQTFGLRPGGSNSSLTGQMQFAHYGFQVGCDANEIFQIYATSTADVVFRFQGYMHDNVTQIINPNEHLHKSLNINQWNNTDFSADVPSNGDGVFVWHTSTAMNHHANIRQNGSAWDQHADLDAYLQCAGSGLDSNQVAQQYVSNLLVDTFLAAYTTTGAAPSNIPVIMNHLKNQGIS